MLLFINSRAVKCLCIFLIVYFYCGISRQCCSHPYLVGPELQPSLNKGLEPSQYLDFDLKASGKLQLLDSMLEELRKSDLRVLILFQVHIFQTVYPLSLKFTSSSISFFSFLVINHSEEWLTTKML